MPILASASADTSESVIMSIFFVLYVYVTHMGQSIFMANIFRGGSLSSLTHINVTKWTQVFFFKLIFPHTFSFAPRGYVLTKHGLILEKVFRQWAQPFV